MNIELSDLYKKTLEKNKLTPQQLPFMDFLKQFYINLKKSNDKKGMEQVEKIIEDSIKMYADGIKNFSIEQLENLKEFCLIDKMIIEKRVKAIENLIGTKNANNKQEPNKN